MTGRSRLLAGPARIDLGSVAVGHSRSAELRVANAGTVPLTITRAIAPIGVFSAPVAAARGDLAGSEDFRSPPDLVRAARRGRFTGSYLIRGTDGRGPVADHADGQGCVSASESPLTELAPGLYRWTARHPDGRLRRRTRRPG